MIYYRGSSSYADAVANQLNTLEETGLATSQAIVAMIGAVIFLLISMGKEFAKNVVFISDDEGFSGKIKTFLLVALFCPFYVIFLLILFKSNINKANKKVKKIKSDLNTN